MRICILLLAILYCCSHATAQYTSDNLAVSDVLRNTFWIKTDTGYASSFIIIENGKELLVTAKHVFKRKNYSTGKVNFEINIDKSWQQINAIIHCSSDTNIDIAIIELSSKLSKISPLALTNNINVGQTCIFLGFPYNFYTTTESEYIPFVKKAMVSSFTHVITFLDGINNPGFSGGPVVTWDPNTSKPAIYGVISGYYPQKNKMELHLTKTNKKLEYLENSGIIFCYPLRDIRNVIDSIK